MRLAGYVVVFCIFLYSFLSLWDLSDFNVLESDFFLTAVGRFLDIFLVIFIAVLIWESVNTYMEHALRKSVNRNATRLVTLLPIVRNIVMSVFLLLFALVILSEIGIDIVPLMAGAGIVGIAVGFGAQAVVKDFLNGFTIILEDLIQVGDVATVGGKTGLIEKITIRKVQLRSLDGTVYTVPFSEIQIVENLTKHFSYYILDVGIAYREDTDEVIGYLKEVDEEMQNEDGFKESMLAPIEILGVDKFADSAVIIKARLKTRPMEQWRIGREFNRRMKYKFDKHGVEIPFPHQTLYFGEDKKGHAPAAPIKLLTDKKKERPKK